MAELVAPRTLEPTRRVGWWTATLTLANAATFAAFFGPLQVLLAQQAQDVSPGSSPAIAAVLVTSPGGYRSLYLLAAGVVFLGSVIVHRIRGVA